MKQGDPNLPPMPALKVTLRNYQQAAVAWMLQRERVAISTTESPPVSGPVSPRTKAASGLARSTFGALHGAAVTATKSAKTSNPLVSKPHTDTGLDALIGWVQLPLDVPKHTGNSQNLLLSTNNGNGTTVQHRTSVYYNPFTGCVAWNLPADRQKELPDPAGGILVSIFSDYLTSICYDLQKH